MKLVTLSVPKISDSPAATRNSSMPLMSPPVVCVTTHDADDRQLRSAWRSKCDFRSGGEFQAAAAASRSSRSASSAATWPTAVSREEPGQAYPIFFFHSASYCRIVFQSPGATLGTYGSFGIVVPHPIA